MYVITMTIIHNYCATDTLVYDDGCHLLKFATNPMRSRLTPTTLNIAKLRIVVDKMHFKGHRDKWCKAHCNPYELSHLDEVNVSKINFNYF